MKKRCPKCKRSFPLSQFAKNRAQKDGLQTYCRACHKKTTQKVRSTPHGYLSRVLTHMKRRARCSLTVDDLLELWEAQRGCCALSGEKMTMHQGRGYVITNCSIDRINPRRGYVLGNIQFVQIRANAGKSNGTTAQFVAFCRKVVRYSGR